MGQIDNLNKSKLPEVLRQVRTQGVGAPMNSGAIGRGGFEVYDGGTINVSSGNLIVNGTATIDGVLNADGTVTLSGTITISGPLTISGATNITGATTITGNTDITGDLDVDGPMTTTGTLSVEGVTTLKNDLNVTTGGEIKAGNTKITADASNGGVEFVSGGGVGGVGGVVAVKGTGNAGLITNTSASVFAGASQLTVADGSVTIDGLPTISSVTSNLYMDPSTKQIKRIV